MAHNNGGGGGCGCRSWILATILYNGFFYVFLTLLLPWMDSAAYADEKPTACAVELAGFKGLHHQAVLAPARAPSPPSSSSPADGAAATSPAFDLVVHVTNGHAFGALKHGGGDVVVSYAGVPLAHGRTPAVELDSKEAAALPVTATSAGGVGVPGDLSRLMADERRWGVAQLQIEFGFASEAFVCDVQLDAQTRVFDCYSPSTSS